MKPATPKDDNVDSGKIKGGGKSKCSDRDWNGMEVVLKGKGAPKVRY